MQSSSGAISINPKIIIWAMDRAGYQVGMLSKSIPQLQQWIDESKRPTLKQLCEFANKLHVPIGYFFCSEPPLIDLPISDFRSINNTPVGEYSINLYDTICLCQERQEWYREYLIRNGFDRIDYIGKASINFDPVIVANEIGKVLKIDHKTRRTLTLENAQKYVIERADEAGILVMQNGVVGNNTSRGLNISEFRGFALSDDYAPLIFINATDSIAGRIFTLIHEIAHLWLGESGVSNIDYRGNNKEIEKWCNHVAAEFLVPLSEINSLYNKNKNIQNEIERLAKYFKTSKIVVIKRLYEIGLISKTTYNECLETELKYHNYSNKDSSKGGNFYNTFNVRTNKKFAQAVFSETYSGNTLFRDAHRLFDIKKASTFEKIAKNYGVIE